MGKYIEVNPDKCTACKICEFYCSLGHEGEVNPSLSRIKVQLFPKQFFYFPNVCRQCGDAPCAEACPTEAIGINEATGAWEIDAEECIGCKLCVKACPFGAMGFGEEEKIAIKCDLCGGNPECVSRCYYGALAFTDPARVAGELARSHAQKELTRIQEEAKS